MVSNFDILLSHFYFTVLHEMKALKQKFQGSFIHVADFSGPTALGLYLQQLKNDSVTFIKIAACSLSIFFFCMMMMMMISIGCIQQIL